MELLESSNPAYEAANYDIKHPCPTNDIRPSRGSYLKFLFSIAFIDVLSSGRERERGEVHFSSFLLTMCTLHYIYFVSLQHSERS